MLKTFTEKLDESFVERAEKLCEDTQEKITPEQVQAAFSGLKELHKKYFPNGETWNQLSALGRASIFWYSTVYPKSKWVNGYTENDPMRASFSINYKGSGKYVIELMAGNQLKVKPSEGSIYAFDTVPVPFRKYTGTPEQIMIRLEDWEKRRKSAVDENQERMI